MKKPLLPLAAVLCSLLPLCCLSEHRAAAAEASVKESVLALLNMQKEAWNRGDLNTFMTGYWQSPAISYTCAGNEVWGYNAIRDRYQKRYGQNRESMGKLAFSDTRILELGKANALCIGHWHLIRDGKEPLDGTFSLVLQRTGKGWKILHDHTSLYKKES